jgi:predicted nucleic acid-binding protein
MDVVADTNVWLRLADDRSAQHGQAKECVARLLAREARIFLLPQNLIEFWAVATRPQDANGLGWSIEQAASKVLEMQGKFDVLLENGRVFEKWFEVVQTEKISGKRAHDARLAVQLWVHNIPNLITFNEGDFAKFSWLSVLRPTDFLADK